LRLTVDVTLRDSDWKILATRQVTVELDSAKELEGLAYGVGEVAQANVVGISKRLMADEVMSLVPVAEVEAEA
jgi:hypothetical protein